MKSLTEYQKLIQRIERLRDQPAREESFRRFHQALKTYAPRFPESGVTLIAGTNGKGSVAKTLETLLIKAGYSVGLFTSPHLMSTTERIRSHARDLTESEFLEAYGWVGKTAEQFSLSHFETLTLMMIEVFFGGRVRKPVERAIVEVGVGGRLDPTRLIPHQTSVITKLGLDHTALLGKDLLSIAREKFAIVDPGNLVVTAKLPPEVRTQFPDVTEASTYSYRVEGDPPRWLLQTPWGEKPLSLFGERAVENASLALTVLEKQGEDIETLSSELANVNWPGRMEGFRINGRKVYLSGDHNPQGVMSVAEILKHFTYKTLRVVIGIGQNKEADEMLSIFRGNKIYLTKTPFRGRDSLDPWKNSVEFLSEDPAMTLRQALADSDTKDLILVTGSLYLVGDLRKKILETNFGTFEKL